MLKNYLLITWRNLRKNRTFSFITVFGLAVSFTCCLLIALYLDYEKSYDKFQEKLPRLYQVGTTMVLKGQPERPNSTTSGPVAAAMKHEFPEVEEATRIVDIFSDEKTLLRSDAADGTDGKSVFETGGYMADPNVFKLFTFHFKEGSATDALADTRNVVLSEEIATKLFGDQPALNRHLVISNSTTGQGDYVVKGVYSAFDEPSHLAPQFIVNIGSGEMGEYIRTRATNFATNNFFYSYLLLKPGADAKKLESKFGGFVKKYYGKDLLAMGRDKRQFLIPVADIHLSETVATNVTPPGSRTYLNILAAIAVLTLVIACVNFMNLSTARSARRSAEVGIRKVLGAERSALITQFLGEAVMLALIAFVVAVALTKLLAPYFSLVTDRAITFQIFRDVRLIANFFLASLLTGLLAGSYPALYLSSFLPVKVLKGRIANSGSVISLRRALVVFQFVISVTLIVASVVINRQMRYMRSAELGFTKDQQLVIPMRSPSAKNNYHALRDALAANQAVVSVGASSYYPGIINKSDNVYYRQGQTMNDAKNLRMNQVDADFLPTLGIRLAAGRAFSSAFPADTLNALVVNEKATRDLGFSSPEKAVGEPVFYDFNGHTNAFRIVGVVKDFHFEDLHTEIAPYAFGLTGGGFNYVVVHVKPGQVSGIISAAERDWKRLNPGEPFDYSFLDQDFNRNYEAGNRVASTVSGFTGIAILLSCLGLFGLATFSVEQRTREIGIRKVLGANISQILALLSAEFLKPVTVAMLVAFPAAWWAMNKWLENFAYRLPVNWLVFVVAALIAWTIAILTIGGQSLKAATANPVKSLKDE